MVAEALGYKTSTIAWSDIYTSMQTGVVEGYTGMQTYSSLQFFADVTKYWVDYNYMPEIMGILMNQKAYGTLPEEYQKIFSEEFEKLALASVDLSQRVNTEAVAAWKDLGSEVIFLTDAERKAIVAKVVAEVWPKMESQYGVENVRALKDSLGLSK
jgi:TRAP-type C4-dicarboxylate transport system substrate-binding protein